jgi:predicted esterase
MPRSPFHLRRRDFLQLVGGSLVVGGCTEIGASIGTGNARLKARPAATTTTLPAGLMRDNHGADVVAYLPDSAKARAQVPVFIFLHGANRGVESFVEAFRPLCDTAGVMLLAPYAYGQTWDAIHGAFDVDVAALDAVLTWAFATVNVDPARLTLSGFSDGATYGLSLGRANGDLFTRLVGFSPGYLLNVEERSRPPIVISHGDQDAVLPFANTRDSIVPTLRSHGYTVEFIPFAGPHAVPLSVAGAEIARLGA